MILSPSDLMHATGSEGRVRLGGRVLAKDDVTATLGDDTADVVVPLDAADVARCGVGAFVVVEAEVASTPSYARVLSARVLRAVAGVDPRGASELQRLRAGVGAALRARASAFRCIRQFFDGLGYVEVDTPVRVSAPGTDVYIDPEPSGTCWLVPSPELQMKRLVAGGMPRIYQLAHAFRRGEHGSWHEPEFCMLEWYEAFTGVDEMMDRTEQLVRAVAFSVGDGRIRPVGGGPVVDVTAPFERVSVADAFARHAGVPDVAHLAQHDENTYFQLLVDRVEPALARSPRPVFLHDYPLSQAALARPRDTAPDFAERFELYLAGVELCNGFGELTDASVQRLRFESDVRRRVSANLPELPIDEAFLRALEEGLPPCSGNALGIDRLLALCLGKEGVESVMAMPQAWIGRTRD